MHEEEAIQRLKTGDITGLEELVLLHQVAAVRAATLITRDRSLAEDVVQAAFLRVYERIDQFDTTRQFFPWFLRIVTNDAIKATRRREKSVSIDRASKNGGWKSAGWFDDTPGPEAIAEKGDVRAAVRQALDTLRPEQRAVIVQHYYLDLSDSEIAKQMKCPPATVRWRLYAARRRLYRLLLSERSWELQESARGR